MDTSLPVDATLHAASGRVVLALAEVDASSVMALLVAAYATAILIKAAARLRGEWGRLCLLAAIVIVPSLTAAWFVYGDIFGALSAAAPSADDPDAWWLLRIKQGDDAPVMVNVLRASLLFGLLAMAASLLVHAGSVVYSRSHDSGWLEIHKAIIKWPVIIVGGLVLLEIDVSAIVLGTSVAVIGIGFLLKETLQNLVTGVTLEVEGSVRQGDWISVSDPARTGKVIEKTWRVTKLLTNNDETLTVPNHLLAADIITNYNRRPHAQVLFVHASHDDPPVKVKEVLRSILMSDPDVLRQPPPVARTIKYNEFSIDYDLKFWIRDYGAHRAIRDRIMTRIWYAFLFHGITIPLPIRTLHHKDAEQLADEKTQRDDDRTTRAEFLRGLPYFADLDGQDLTFLAQNSFAKRYAPGDHVLHKGELGDALHIVQEGTCRALLPDGPRDIVQGRYFGEMGLLTAGPRTVDVVAGPDGALVLRVDKHCMDVLFRSRPEVRSEFLGVSRERARELHAGELPAPAPRTPWTQRLARGALRVLRPW